MKSLSGLLAFVRTAETLSFAKAGHRLGLSPSAVGKGVTRLEHHLGVRLLHRSTRRLSLTAEGAVVFERFRQILDDVQDVEAAMAHAASVPSGRLFIGLPTIGYRFLMPYVHAFQTAYPQIDLEFDFNDRLIDIVADGVDAVIRSGNLPDSELMSRRLGGFRFLLCAAPSYVARAGLPTDVADLANHACLRFRFPSSGKVQDWGAGDDRNGPLVQGRSVLICNNMEAMRAAAIAGAGITQMPDFLVEDALADGTLVSILPRLARHGGDFWLLWPPGRHLSPKLRVFVDFFAGRLFRGDEAPHSLTRP
jgi:DNA-binding transcriptional LysR family regulator